MNFYIITTEPAGSLALISSQGFLRFLIICHRLHQLKIRPNKTTHQPTAAPMLDAADGCGTVDYQRRVPHGVWVPPLLVAVAPKICAIPTATAHIHKGFHKLIIPFWR